MLPADAAADARYAAASSRHMLRHMLLLHADAC